MGFLKPAFFLVSANALVTALCYGANTAFPLIPKNLILPGTFGLVALAHLVAFLYSFLFRPKHVTKTAYFMATFFFLVSCFDLASVVDFQMRPNNILLSHYYSSGDPMFENLWIEVIVYFYAALPHLFNYIIFYRMFNGLSWRSLELFNLSTMIALVAGFCLPLFPGAAQVREKQTHMSKNFYGFIFVMLYFLKTTLGLDRVTNLGKGEKTGSGKGKQQQQQATGFFSSFLFKIIAFVLTLESIALITYQVGVMHNTELSPLTGHNLTSDLLRQNSPFLFFEPVKGLLPFGLTHVWNHAAIVLPTLLINLIFIFRRNGPLPSFLWDINVFSTGLVYIGQGYLLLGPLFPETPKAYRVDPTNLLFWAVNLTPFITCVVNILVLTPFRRSIPGAGIKTGAGAGDSKKKR